MSNVNQSITEGKWNPTSQMFNDLEVNDGVSNLQYLKKQNIDNFLNFRQSTICAMQSAKCSWHMNAHKGDGHETGPPGKCCNNLKIKMI